MSQDPHANAGFFEWKINTRAAESHTIHAQCTLTVCVHADLIIQSLAATGVRTDWSNRPSTLALNFQPLIEPTAETSGADFKSPDTLYIQFSRDSSCRSSRAEVERDWGAVGRLGVGNTISPTGAAEP